MRRCCAPIPRRRDWEFRLRREIFWAEQMQDDRTLSPAFDIAHVRAPLDWGLAARKIGGQDGGAYRWDAPIRSDADLAALHPPILCVDFAGTEQLAALAHATFGDLYPVRVRTLWWWTVGLTWTLADLRGLQELMLDMVEAPARIHRLMQHLSDGTAALLDALEARGLLAPNYEGMYVGSGGLGWTDDLPDRDGFNAEMQGRTLAPAVTARSVPGGDAEISEESLESSAPPRLRASALSPSVRLRDMWGFAESQETVGVSPRMFAEFVLPYQIPLLERFGLNCYGCCEPLDKRWRT